MNTVSVPYVNTPDYYSQVASSVEKFIQQNHYDPDRILGVSVATQGCDFPEWFSCNLWCNYEQCRNEALRFRFQNSLSLPSGT